MALFPKKKKKSEPSELELENDRLAAQIKELESFIAEAPKKMEREHQDKLHTMPAPDDIIQRQRENKFAHRLSKHELKNERRHQSKSLLILILLVIMIIAVACWVLRIVAQSGLL